MSAAPPPPNERLRMPTVFGPGVGPRRGPDGRPFDYAQAPRVGASVSFLSTHAALSPLLPPGFELVGEPVVTVEWSELLDLPWLAGRGYRMLGVKYEACFRGQRDVASGPFLAVLWENRPEPILTGREELGFAKLFCELPDARAEGSATVYAARWDGHEFMRLRISDPVDAAPPPAPPAVASATRGTLHYRYLPRVSAPGEADVAQAVLTPAGGHPLVHERFQRARGSVEFVESSFEQLPTLFHIVNTLARLPVIEWRGATLGRSRGSKDLSDQRVLV